MDTAMLTPLDIFLYKANLSDGIIKTINDCLRNHSELIPVICMDRCVAVDIRAVFTVDDVVKQSAQTLKYVDLSEDYVLCSVQYICEAYRLMGWTVKYDRTGFIFTK